MENGKQIALQALSGMATDRVPVALFNWEFDYTWKAAGIEPWRLAVGGSDTWHEAHRALMARHDVDLLFYTGAIEGPLEPTLLKEDATKWVIRNNNTGMVYGLTKDSLSLYEQQTGAKGCGPVGKVETFEDADRLIRNFRTDRLIPTFAGWGDAYLSGLTRLIREAGDRTLILPHYSPAYVYSCYALGFEDAMLMMMENPALFTYVCALMGADHHTRMRQLKEAGAEVVFIADGWASCDIISPELFERFALPCQVSIVAAARAAGLKTILWNEGDILPVLKQQATVPVDAFAFEQPRKAIDLTVEKVRQVFGPNRCLFGNLDSELLLMRNEPDEIKREVERQIRQSGPGAPFILCTGSPLPSNIEPDAYDRVIEAARAYSWAK
ncbi:MAG: uroporphyrinogen decarboxylase family protein [bacterium]